MPIKELLKHLKYSRCDCPIDFRKTIGVINGRCPRHSDSVLLVNGLPYEFYKALHKKNAENKHKSEGP